MWAAMPRMRTPRGPVFGARVDTPHRQQVFPARSRNSRFTSEAESSRWQGLGMGKLDEQPG